ncbi:MAG: DivIVA domain-containing protein, partial [Longispora sp.]|nr:DivIVA domain-containing protein [Longispora sp. (in: high G+C Gram-positive bacteria)]
MTSQGGQRFRRRALRRGYKVDEVDNFIDRAEATLAGESTNTPVTAQEAHDVVFRVRFGGYDEWQVDLHLDRVERQLAEFEDRGGRPPAPDPLRDSMRGGLNAGGMSGAGMGRPDMGNT